MEGKAASLLPAVLLAGFMVSCPVIADDQTTVIIRGTVKANTCTINRETPADLPPVSVRDFEGKSGKTLGLIDIPIKFTACGGGTTGVRVKVSGAATGSDGAFKNDDDGKQGGATNVGVYFYDTNNTPIRAGSSNALEQKFKTDTTLTYKAQYVSLSPNVGAGTLRTVITMNFTYL